MVATALNHKQPSAAVPNPRGPLLLADWGSWPPHLQFTNHRYHEINSSRRFHTRRQIRKAAQGRGFILHYLNHRGVYVPYRWYRP